MDELKSRIAQGLKRLRLEKDYTQEYLADVLGKGDYTAYYRLESGKADLKFEDAFKLSMLYKIPMEHIYDPDLRDQPREDRFEEAREKYLFKNRMSISVSLDGEEENLTRQIEILKGVNALLAAKI